LPDYSELFKFQLARDLLDPGMISPRARAKPGEAKFTVHHSI
jgi:hypothetical protein